MALSALCDKSKKPTENDVARVVCRAKAAWDTIIDHVERQCSGITREWNMAGQKWGWSLRLRFKKRNLLYMTPCNRYFTVGFVLGKKAVQVARQSGLPKRVVGIINQAPVYPEGTAIRFEIRKKKDLDPVKKLVGIKLAN